MRTINTSQASYHATTGQYGTLTELGDAGYIADTALSGGGKSGYTFDVRNITSLNYEVVADPVIDPLNAFQHYYIDASAIIRVEVGGSATQASTALQ